MRRIIPILISATLAVAVLPTGDLEAYNAVTYTAIECRNTIMGHIGPCRTRFL